MLCCTRKSLFQIKIFNEVQVYIVRNAHLYPLDEVSRVCCHVKMTCKTERLGVEGYENKIHTLLVIDHEGIHDIILVIAGCNVCQRTNKFISKDNHLLVE